MGVVVQNFLVPLLSPSLTPSAIQYGVTFAYFVSVIFFTRTEMKRLARARKEGDYDAYADLTDEEAEEDE